MPCLESEFRGIADHYGELPSEPEEAAALHYIDKTTYRTQGNVQVPPISEDYTILPRDAFSDPKEFANRLVDIFRRPDRTTPEFVFVLTEEPVANPHGVTKFRFLNFLRNAVPYIHQYGLGTNYWATDLRRTITFHQSQIYYFNTPTATPR